MQAQCVNPAGSHHHAIISTAEPIPCNEDDLYCMYICDGIGACCWTFCIWKSVWTSCNYGNWTCKFRMIISRGNSVWQLEVQSCSVQDVMCFNMVN